jgi:hypothetical protein
MKTNKCKIKSGSALISPDKHKTLQVRRLPFALLLGVTYDLEGLGAAAGFGNTKNRMNLRDPYGPSFVVVFSFLA